jgi:MFS family permease
LDLKMIRANRLFAAGTSAALLNYMAVFAVTTLTAVFLEIVEGYSAQRAGLVLLTQPLLMVALSAPAGRLSDRVGSRPLATGGMLLVALGMVQLGILPESAHVARIVLSLAIIGVGMAAFSAPNTSAVMGSVDRRELSFAAGFLSTMRSMGQTISVALLGGIAAAGLGPTGRRVLLLGEKASAIAAASYSSGYRTAMFVGAGLAVMGAAVSMVRGGVIRQGAPVPEARGITGDT